jgi:hypothetical protein
MNHHFAAVAAIESIDIKGRGRRLKTRENKTIAVLAIANLNHLIVNLLNLRGNDIARQLVRPGIPPRPPFRPPAEATLSD